MKTCNLHTKIPNSRKQIRKNTNLEMRNSKAFWVLFSSVCTNVNKKGRQKMSALFCLPFLFTTYPIVYNMY